MTYKAEVLSCLKIAERDRAKQPYITASDDNSVETYRWCRQSVIFRVHSTLLLMMPNAHFLQSPKRKWHREQLEVFLLLVPRERKRRREKENAETVYIHQWCYSARHWPQTNSPSCIASIWGQYRSCKSYRYTAMRYCSLWPRFQGWNGVRNGVRKGVTNGVRSNLRSATRGGVRNGYFQSIFQ